MESHNPSPRPTAEKIAFDPAEYGLNPDENLADRELVEKSHGDLFLYAHEASLKELNDWHNSLGRSTGAQRAPIEELQGYYKRTAQLREIIEKRHKELGIPSEYDH